VLHSAVFAAPPDAPPGGGHFACEHALSASRGGGDGGATACARIPPTVASACGSIYIKRAAVAAGSPPQAPDAGVEGSIWRVTGAAAFKAAYEALRDGGSGDGGRCGARGPSSASSSRARGRRA
jgi:hypothetical protein